MFDGDRSDKCTPYLHFLESRVRERHISKVVYGAFADPYNKLWEVQSIYRDIVVVVVVVIIDY